MSFLDSNPLCPCPLPQVDLLFSRHLDLSLLGVSEQPLLREAFEILMARKKLILTSYEWTSSVFGYMDTLIGIDKDEIANLSFIPLKGYIDY